MKVQPLQTRLNQAPRGFTLIELMITVAIIGILAAIALPSYNQYIIKSNRSAAETFMFQLANKEEQYLLDARQYTSDPNVLLATPSEVLSNYTVTIPVASVSANTYSIVATPSGNQASKDTKCGTLTLTQNGTKQISGTGTVSDCW